MRSLALMCGLGVMMPLMDGSTIGRARGHPRHLLCSDDAPDVLRVLHDLLDDSGYRVTTWTDADEGLDEVVDLAPDLILLDDLLRDGQTSWSLLQWLTLDQRTRHLPVILLTGAVEQLRERERNLRRMGVTIVPKPFDLDYLLHTIGTLLVSAMWAGHGA